MNRTTPEDTACESDAPRSLNHSVRRLDGRGHEVGRGAGEWAHWDLLGVREGLLRIVDRFQPDELAYVPFAGARSVLDTLLHVASVQRGSAYAEPLCTSMCGRIG
jgi:hypothetical protein